MATSTGLVAVIGYVSPQEREQANATASACHETTSQLIGRLLREEAERIERKQRREAAKVEANHV